MVWDIIESLLRVSVGQLLKKAKGLESSLRYGVEIRVCSIFYENENRT
jgi:hypothetical protein